MLDSDTKRRIDSARDILVGKVPDPKSQVEQITIALIYKFMDDMDAEAEELGGKRKFFTGDFARYGWAKLMRSGLGGHETLALYGEGITKMTENPGLPPLFRDIFKNAYLPYRDPETLKSFLKIIDEFSYDHSERLGDAFEYLLSVLGSQGDAGQFRTPRHIIDFMVEVVKPQKNETILDPACGTAGFLISAYKHILRANTDANGHSSLTPEEKGKLATHIKGYDISPDMVRLSLVNLYLHGFSAPHIYEYDTLTSEERWNEFADVILANPPFMTPTGGIRPHRRFTVQAGKAEVLFVDYIMEHLSPTGRAGIVVPEGILENSGRLFVELRKIAVANGLFAVVSLPVGVFQPYSGNIKTSILFFDKGIRKIVKEILHLRIDNDGYELGRQRRPLDTSDLPWALSEIAQFRSSGMSVAVNAVDDPRLSCLGKDALLSSRDCNLASPKLSNAQEHWHTIDDLFEIEKGTLQSSKNVPGTFTFITAADDWKTHKSFTHDCEALVFAMGASGSLGRTHYVKGKFIASDLCFILTPKKRGKFPINLKYYFAYFGLMRERIVAALARGAAKKAINMRNFSEMRVPYCSIARQDTIVETIAKRNEVIRSEQEIIEKHRKKITEEEEKIRIMVLESHDG
jgi:type I restriction enzyme M protein